MQLIDKYINVKSIEKDFITGGLLTTSFWALQNLFQRSAGLVGLHGARSWPVTLGVGMIATSCNLLLAQFATEKAKVYIEPHLTKSNWPSFIKDWTSKKTNRSVRKEYLQRFCVGLSAYFLLEQAMFRTSFPSSVIAPGVFSNALNLYTNSIQATSPIATEGERNKIQRLGKLHGCHQCGSRHWFTKETFIADHMPPTKFAKEMNNRWWRKWFKIEVPQRLWAQCRNCFSLQGSAVRSETHIPVYHGKLRLAHFAPAIALAVVQNPDLTKWMDCFIEPTLDSIEKCERYLKNRFEK